MLFDAVLDSLADFVQALASGQVVAVPQKVGRNAIHKDARASGH